MKLSVIIVNYNVQYFLSNCLQSVLKAAEKVETEVIVIDNNSVDHSVEIVKRDFPTVKLIVNQDNRGFSTANNQGINIAQGDFILLLNPDTVVEEDCFIKCVQYMENHPDVGGLGVKMIDGAGRFLPESKRGLPTPAVAFYKIFGLSRIFPRSKRFGAYHLGYLSNDEIHTVDVLSGAFMLLRKFLIDKIGGLDEAFFMYGEDIDLSYRITQAGYKNVYFPEAQIIHFKGESTKKSSVNYVLVFYRAMIIFAQKHFSYPNARLLSFLIHAAIYFRASLAIVNRFLQWAYMPAIDVLVLAAFLKGLKWFYEMRILEHPGYLPEAVEWLAFPAMIAFWIICQYFFGGYRQPVKRTNILKGLTVGALLIFVLYALLDESLRFSRGLVSLSVLGSFIILPLTRLILQKIGLFQLERVSEFKTGIIGNAEEIKRVATILQESAEKRKKLYFIHPKRKSEIENAEKINFTGSLYQLKDIMTVYKLDELVFCLKDIPAERLIAEMQQPALRRVNIYLSPASGNYMLRSSSNEQIGEYIIPEEQPEMNRWSSRKKRMFEFFIATVMLILSPVLFFLFRKPLTFISNMYAVLIGKIDMIGMQENQTDTKPALIRPFTSTTDGIRNNTDAAITNYLLHYSMQKDLEIVLSNLNLLDKKIENQGV